MSASAEMRRALLAATLLTCATTSAFALDVNSFRAQHRLPPLSHSAALAGAAYEHAHSLAKRERLDHDGFKQRVGRLVSGMAAENVSFGCEDQDCAIKQWARSAGHRANMLLKGITSYGIASARGDNGRRYWVLELGN
ncbi:CAP domain-containing protein [Pseudolabrys sp. Root1462]|uniref:CAP domain-containing protein n=1 Tax=Pseudolabrys sp. Root1462 TaxID=1736466 RepID=UPI0009EB307C|nr:CAP domain-containing protein [Pseudolabrys sp. Root1462]